MWKSRRVCGISKGRWKGWESGFCFSTLSTGPAFPQPSSILIICPNYRSADQVQYRKSFGIGWDPTVRPAGPRFGNLVQVTYLISLK